MDNDRSPKVTKIVEAVSGSPTGSMDNFSTKRIISISKSLSNNVSFCECLDYSKKEVKEENNS
jgi:hypothetical protein